MTRGAMDGASTRRTKMSRLLGRTLRREPISRTRNANVCGYDPNVCRSRADPRPRLVHHQM